MIRHLNSKAAVLSALLALGGCGAPPSNLPDAEVLRFGLSHWGRATTLVVRSDGSATYRKEGTDGVVTVEATVPRAELDALAAELERRGLCGFVSGRDVGIPDESRPSIAVRLGGLDCKVKMWDNEFRDDEDASAALAAVERFAASLKPRRAEPAVSVEKGTPSAPPTAPQIEVIGPFVAGVHGMAVHDDGRLFFSDSYGRRSKERRIYVIEPPYTGEPVATSLSGGTPAGLAWIDGALFVCDAKAGTVIAHGSDLAPTTTWKVDAPWSVVRHPQRGPLVVTNDGRVVALEPGGATRELFGGGLAPFAIAIDSSGALWMTEQGAKQGDPGRVALRSLEGAVVREATYSWANPEGMALGADGALWVAETERGELVRVTATGVDVMKSGLKLPVVVTPTKDGDLFVSTGGKEPTLVRVRFQR